MGFLNKVFGKKEDEKVISNSRLTHVFISYGTRDTDVANDVCNLVESCNAKCWIAPRDVKGVDSTEEMKDAMIHANILIFIFSEFAIRSQYILKELELAIKHNVPIIVFNVDGSMPEGEWQFHLQNARWIDASPDYENHYEDLMDALREEYNSMGLHRVVDLSSFKENRNLKETAKKDSLPKELDLSEGDEDYIFISYKHADADLVVPIIESFQKRGYRVWFDQGLKYGEDYDDLIDLKIDGSSLFIIFITETVIEGAYDSDEYMKKELDVAIDTNTKIFPIFLHEVGLKGKYRMQLRGKHSIFLHEYESKEEFLDDCIKAFQDDFGLEPSM
jgi:hypothetical protein